MGHNYARPLTAQARLERVLGHLPAEWSVVVERPAGQGWSAFMRKPDGSEYRSSGAGELADALEEAWRALR